MAMRTDRAVLIILAVLVVLFLFSPPGRRLVDGWKERRLVGQVEVAEGDAAHALLAEVKSRLADGRLQPESAERLAAAALARADLDYLPSGRGDWVGLLEQLADAGLLGAAERRAWIERMLADTRVGPGSGGALSHLLRGLDSGRIGSEDRDEIIDVACAVHGATFKGRQRSAGVGVFLAGEYRSGRLSDERWASLLRQGYEPQLCVRPMIRQGAALPVRMEPGRKSSLSREMSFVASVVASRLAGRSIDVDVGPAQEKRIDLGEPLPPGDHRLQCTVRIDARPHEGTEPGLTPLSWEVDVELPFEVVPADERVVEMVELEPEDLAFEVEVTIQNPRVEIRAASDTAILTFENVYAPVAYSYSVWLQHEDSRRRLGEYFCDSSDRTTHSRGRVGLRDLPRDFGGESIDLVLRPDLELAEKYVDGHQIRGGEIRLDDTPIVRGVRRSP